MRASGRGYTGTVRVLLENKVNLSITDEVREIIILSISGSYIQCIVLQDGWTALHWASSYGHVEVVKMLVNYGIAVDIKNRVMSIDNKSFLMSELCLHVFLILHVMRCAYTLP